MKKLAYILLLTLTLNAADTLVFGEESTNVVENSVQEKKVQQKVYSVRFMSVPMDTPKSKILHSIPKDLRADTKIVPSGKYLTAMYKERLDHDAIVKDLKYIRQKGYKDAYIRSHKKFVKAEKEYKRAEKKSVKTLRKEVAKKRKNSFQRDIIRPKISKFTNSRIVYKANDAYKKGDYMQAIIFYEMLVASGNASRKIKNNLCYLYGRVGAFAQAEEIINSSKHPAKLIYAYAYGAATTGQENYYSNLSKYISYDRSGKLMLLSGYYFEMKEQRERALTFYKMAYEQNPSDIYNLYAYARAEDILNHKKSALSLYKKITKLADVSSEIYKVAKKRESQLGE